MSIDGFNKQAESLSNEGYSIIESLAREVMKKEKRIMAFTMAMGTWFFQDYDGCIIDQEFGVSGEYRAIKYFRKSLFKPLMDFLGEHDEVFGFTGMPMHFKRGGEIITKW